MSKRMLIDAAHPEETRVVVINDGQLEEFEFESSTKKQLKGNIYLAKVTRVEPSLQAAFVDYGGQRHGFLAFSEIHPDYYQIPQADRRLLDEAERQVAEVAEGNGHPEEAEEAGSEAVATDPDEEAAEVFDEQARRRSRLLRSYKIQEVIKRRQILLVQVVKEERGSKGAALTTYLSLAGRYSVLMPNTARGGGISRKIANPADRSRLKAIARELEVPEGMGLIIRTAGQERSKLEIRRDYEYSLRLWNDIRDRTLQSIAPCTIHEEGALVKRAIRDLYARDIDEVWVEGEEGYRGARKVMGMLTPSRARRVRLYKEEVPLFHQYGVEERLDALHNPVINLPSGGSVVIHVTEALTAIDVNSGRSTR
jgi:ribonuclease E